MIGEFIKEGNEIKPNIERKEDIRLLKFSIYKNTATVMVKLRGTIQKFPKCGSEGPNCFEYPSNFVKDGVYTVDNFRGDLFFTYQAKKYRCKLEKPCQPI